MDKSYNLETEIMYGFDDLCIDKTCIEIMKVCFNFANKEGLKGNEHTDLQLHRISASPDDPLSQSRWSVTCTTKASKEDYDKAVKEHDESLLRWIHEE